MYVKPIIFVHLQMREVQAFQNVRLVNLDFPKINFQGTINILAIHMHPATIH